MFLRNHLRRAKAVKLKRPKYCVLLIFSMVLLVGSLFYGLLSTMGYIPSLTFNYIYPFLKKIFHLELYSLHFSEVFFEKQSLSKGVVNFLSLIMLHLFDVFIYVFIASKTVNLISNIIVRQRLGSAGYKKLVAIKLLSDEKRQKKAQENEAAVKESFSHITLKHERSRREAQNKRESSKLGVVFVVGVLFGIFFFKWF